MTERERIQIRKRRSQGQSMEAIASSLGLNRNTVKSYCKREGITPRLDPDQNKSIKTSPNTGYCASCHKPIEHIPKQKPKRFCSDRCRYQWWGEHRKEHSTHKAHEQSCAYCKELFYSPAKRKYCSHPCYIKARFGGEA